MLDEARAAAEVRAAAAEVYSSTYILYISMLLLVLDEARAAAEVRAAAAEVY